MQDIKNTIIKKLNNLENIEILYACESGSRAWGFESKDSDYDVRFIYLRKAKDYLKINAPRDTIEQELNETYDIMGWDLKKCLTLLLKSNPKIFEWADSSIVYKTSSKWQSIVNILDDFAQYDKLLYYYFGVASNDAKLIFKNEKTTLKRYFYILREILACKWILEFKKPVPMAFDKLNKALLPNELKQLLDQMLKAKANTNEKDEIAHIATLDRYILAELEDIRPKLKNYPKSDVKQSAILDEIFFNLVSKSF